MPITQSFLNKVAPISFTDSDAIDNYFLQNYHLDFITWFNTYCAAQKNWGNTPNHAALSIAHDGLAHDRFDKIWSNDGIKNMFGINSISLLQFISLMSIIINETGGSMLPLTERVGMNGHPGIAYAFDKIAGLKRSYNTLAGNKTCFQLFNDVNYNHAFGNMPLANQLKNTTNGIWAGEVYPQTVSFSTNPMLSGYVLQADFYKFRGRGFIQTTGRANYAQLIKFVQNYTGNNSYLLSEKLNWAKWSANADVLATVSSNEEWDNLFQKTDSIIAAKGIGIHNVSSNNYLSGINASNPTTAFNTIRNVGLRISGGAAYADLYISRVVQIIEAM
ncbi:MAG: hypothetical protein RI955_1901 [Bacteroidota bacterium]|jgi:hypothetical protein